MNIWYCFSFVALVFGTFVSAQFASASELLDAIHAQDVNRVRMAIEAGGNVNASDEEGYFPLYFSIAYESPELTELLLKAGADVHKLDPEYAMPMVAHAAAIGNLTIVQQLLRFNADPKATDKFGGTALEEAAYNGFTKIAKLLKENGAKTRWPVHVAAGLGDLTELRKLIPKLKDADLKTPGWENTPLHFATSGGNVYACKMLLEAGANPNKKNRFGASPLHIASDIGSVPLVKLLLSKGADPNQRDKEGATPGQYSENKEIQKLLRISR